LQVISRYVISSLKRTSSFPWRSFKNRFLGTVKKQVLETKEKPQKVALGCALGACVNFIPTLGAGFQVTFSLASLFKVNQASATLTSLLFWPLVPFMYAFNLYMGRLILTPGLEFGGFRGYVIEQYAQVLVMESFRGMVMNSIGLLGPTFLLGTLINIAVFGTLLYYLTMFILKKINCRNMPVKWGL